MPNNNRKKIEYRVKLDEDALTEGQEGYRETGWGRENSRARKQTQVKE